GLQHAVDDLRRHGVAVVLLCLGDFIEVVIGGDDDRPMGAVILVGWVAQHARLGGHEAIAPVVPVLGDAIGRAAAGVVRLLRQVAAADTAVVVLVGSHLHQIGHGGAHRIAHWPVQAVIDRLVDGAVGRRRYVLAAAVVVAVL